jgi:hypothetical protein
LIRLKETKFTKDNVKKALKEVFQVAGEDERLKIEEKEYFKMSEIHESHQRNMNINQRKGRRI